ncbi:MAG: hypothetical protein HPY53_00765 [Brevinematales bacterium]|nr:hypothetical protein [Brevinematales bacterium]
MKKKIKKYEFSLISYFDVLGFKTIIDTHTASEIDEILEGFEKVSLDDFEFYKELKGKGGKDLAQEFGQKYLFFSDTIIRLVNILSNSNKQYPMGLFF